MKRLMGSLVLVLFVTLAAATGCAMRLSDSTEIIMGPPIVVNPIPYYIGPLYQYHWYHPSSYRPPIFRFPHYPGRHR